MFDSNISLPCQISQLNTEKKKHRSRNSHPLTATHYLKLTSTSLFKVFVAKTTTINSFIRFCVCDKFANCPQGKLKLYSLHWAHGWSLPLIFFSHLCPFFWWPSGELLLRGLCCMVHLCDTVCRAEMGIGNHAPKTTIVTSNAPVLLNSPWTWHHLPLIHEYSEPCSTLLLEINEI